MYAVKKNSVYYGYEYQMPYQEQTYIDKYYIPELTANSSEYGTCNQYQFTTSQTNLATFTMNFNSDYYIPIGSKLSFHFESQYIYSPYDWTHPSEPYAYRYGDKGLDIVVTYTDDTSETVFNANFFSWVNGSFSQPPNQTKDYTIPTLTAKIIKKVTVNTHVVDVYWGGGYDAVFRQGGKFRLWATIPYGTVTKYMSAYKLWMRSTNFNEQSHASGSTN